VSENALAVEIRSEKGKGAARRMREAGRIPAILYGHGNEPTPLSLDPRRLDTILRSSEMGINTLIDLEGDARFEGKMVMVKELQRDPVRGSMLHADFLEIAANETVYVSVPVHVRGTPVGVSLSGGIVDQVLREVDLECLPRAIPEELVLDISALEIGDSLHVRDIALPGGVTLRTDGNLSVVSVMAPSAALEEAAAAPAEAAPVEGAAPEAAKPAEE